MRLDRHQIVYLDPAAWPALVGEQAATPAVAEWAMLGRPLIARRPVCSDGAGRVPLGLPLPPSMGKQRLAFTATPDAIRSHGLPPLLADAAAVAPPAWHPTLAAIVAIDREVRCFGSLAWEHLTGLPYLSPTSDLDLLWHVSTANAADRLSAAIDRIEAGAPMQIDGEIVSPGGLAVQWREWASAAHDVLAKAWDGNRIVARRTVFS